MVFPGYRRVVLPPPERPFVTVRGCEYLFVPSRRAAHGWPDFRRRADAARRRGRGRALGSPAREPEHVVADRYRLVRHLGAGTSKDVFQAWDEKLRRDVAVGLVAGVEGDARTRVLREVETTAQLDHPHIVTVHDVGEEEQAIFIVTQLVRGGSAADWAARAEPGETRVRTAVHSPARSPPRCSTRTPRTSSIATSSPATSCSPTTAWRS